MSFEDRLPEFLGRQRWFAGGPPDRVDVRVDEALVDGATPMRRLVVNDGSADYSLLVGQRPVGEVPDTVTDDLVIYVAGDRVVYDALADADMAL